MHYTTLSEINQGSAVYIIKPQARCTLARDEIQGRLAALDEIRRPSCVDDMPNLRESPKLGKLLADGESEVS